MEGSSQAFYAPPINIRLPVEMLGRVFVLLRDCPEFPSDVSHIHASHVCRHWRAVALGCPELWSTIRHQSQLDWIKILLQRSGAFPLKVWLDRDHSSSPHFYEKACCILQELHRIEELTLCIDHNEAIDEAHVQGKQEIFRLINNGSAPFLRTLRFSGNKDQLSQLLFNGKPPPNLRRVALSRCTLPASFHLFTAPLTHLELQYCEDWSTMDDVLSLLSSLPALQSFIFFYYKAAQSMTTFTTRRKHPIVLSTLARLNIFGTVIFITCFLRQLSFPPDIRMSISGQNEAIEGGLNENAQATADSLVDAIRPHLTSVFMQDGDFDTCAIEMSSHPVLQPMLSLSATRFKEDNINSQPAAEQIPCFKFDVCDFAEHRPGLCDALWKMLVRLPGLKDPKTLVMKHSSHFKESSHWMELLDVWRNVTTITLEGSPFYALVEALSVSHAHPYIPKLSSMTIRGVDLNGSYLLSGSDVAIPFLGLGLRITDNGPSIIDRLVTAIIQRNARGCSPVKYLIEQCDVSRERVQDLRKALEGGIAVFWDGKEKAWTEEKVEKFKASMAMAHELVPILNRASAMADDEEFELENDDDDWGLAIVQDVQ